MFWIRLIELIVMLLAIAWSLIWANYLWRYEYLAAPMFIAELDTSADALKFSFSSNVVHLGHDCRYEIELPLPPNRAPPWTVADAREPSELAILFDLTRVRALGKWTEEVKKADDPYRDSGQPDECSHAFWAGKKSSQHHWEGHNDVARQIREVEQKAVVAMATRISSRRNRLFIELFNQFLLYGVGVSIIVQLLVFGAFSAIPHGGNSGGGRNQ